MNRNCVKANIKQHLNNTSMPHNRRSSRHTAALISTRRHLPHIAHRTAMFPHRLEHNMPFQALPRTAMQVLRFPQGRTRTMPSRAATKEGILVTGSGCMGE